MEASDYQKNLIAELAAKHGLSKKQVEDAVYSQSKLLRQVMEDGNNEGVRMPYFGVFEVSKKQLTKLYHEAARSGEQQADNISGSESDKDI